MFRLAILSFAIAVSAAGADAVAGVWSRVGGEAQNGPRGVRLWADDTEMEIQYTNPGQSSTPIRLSLDGVERKVSDTRELWAAGKKIGGVIVIRYRELSEEGAVTFYEGWRWEEATGELIRSRTPGSELAPPASEMRFQRREGMR